MDITNTQLKEIILDETLRLLAEKTVKRAGPGAPFHSKDAGQFTDSN